MVYPAAMFAPQVSARGVPVAEFNMETTPATERFRYGVTRVGPFIEEAVFGPLYILASFVKNKVPIVARYL